MRAESGVCDGTRNGEGAALGLTPADIVAEALRAAERKADLAAKAAMVWLLTRE